VKAWTVLCEVLGVASATANKALGWLHAQGIIGYFAGKNGVGVRIFLNRATSSIGARTESGAKKILPFAPASKQTARASFGETAFKDSYAVLESLETDYDPHAPENGAATNQAEQLVSSSTHCQPERNLTHDAVTVRAAQAQTGEISATTLNQLAHRLQQTLEPALTTVATRAAEREHERTREWLEKHGLPKAARVAQREAYNLLRQYGLLKDKPQRVHEGREVDRQQSDTLSVQPLSAQELEELASTCLAMLEIHGQAVDATLAALGTQAGGYLASADAAQVQAMAEAMIKRELTQQTR
jgi:uncharacterized protein YejL (UPF0352 family)